MRKLLLLLIAAFLGIVQLHAQDKTITGRITDEKGSPVPKASVVAKGTKNGTSTSDDRLYSIVVPATAKALVISSVNFETIEVSIGSGNVLNVTLKTSTASLQEVVIVGYGSGKKIGSTVGSIATVNAEKIQD